MAAFPGPRVDAGPTGTPLTAAGCRRAGDVVLLRGVEGRDELDGVQASIRSWDPSAERGLVAVKGSGEELQVLDASLRASERLSVTVLSGLPGAGKTALASRLLDGEPRVGWLQARADALVDMVVEVMRLAARGRLDHLLLEAAGTMDPLAIAELFRPAPIASGDGEEAEQVLGSRRRQGRERRKALADAAELDTLVSVLDARALLERLRAAAPGAEGLEARLLLGQAGFADMLVLSRCDALSKEELAEVKVSLEVLNSEAGILTTSACEVPSYEILGRGAYMWRELGVAQPSRKWLQHAAASAASERALLGLAGRWGSGAGCTCCPPQPASMQGGLAEDGEDRPPGISAFVYRAVRPFRPGQLAAILAAGALPGAVRAARGSAWVASRPGHSIVWSSLGNTTILSQGSDWWAAVPKTQWPAALAEQLRMQGQLTEQGEWTEPLRGDRRTELLVVGVAMSRREVEGCLDALLVSEEELGEGLETWADDSDFSKYLQAEPKV